MSERRLLDTNVIVRHLTRDEPRLARTADQLFERCDRGEITLVLLPVVLAECVFLLSTFYKRTRGEIVEMLGAMVDHSGIDIEARATHRDALARYAETNCHFVDCLIAAHAAASGAPVASFDRDLRKFRDVRVAVD